MKIIISLARKWREIQQETFVTCRKQSVQTHSAVCFCQWVSVCVPGCLYLNWKVQHKHMPGTNTHAGVKMRFVLCASFQCKLQSFGPILFPTSGNLFKNVEKYMRKSSKAKIIPTFCTINRPETMTLFLGTHIHSKKFLRVKNVYCIGVAHNIVRDFCPNFLLCRGQWVTCFAIRRWGNKTLCTLIMLQSTQNIAPLRTVISSA